MWLCMIGVGVLMLIAAFRTIRKIEELHHRKIFKTMKNSYHIVIAEYLLGNVDKREKRQIRDRLNEILLCQTSPFKDGRICEEDMKKVRPLMKEWVRTNRLILVFPLVWITAFSIAMKIYVG